MTVKKIDAVATITPEQRRSRGRASARDREEQKRAFEQRRRDVALVNTYTSTREIDDARERTLQPCRSQALKGVEPRLKKAQERLAACRAGGKHQNAGKTVPSTLQDEGNEQKLEVDSLRRRTSATRPDRGDPCQVSKTTRSGTSNSASATSN